MFDEKKLSPEAAGLNNGCAQRAAWFHRLLEAAAAQGCDIEKLTDDAIFSFGVDGVPQGAGDDPLDFLAFMTANETFFELFGKEVIEKTPDYCELRFHNCPLVSAWKKQGLTSERVSRLCDLANKGDFGKASQFKNVTLTIPDRLGAGDTYCTLCIDRKKPHGEE